MENTDNNENIIEKKEVIGNLFESLHYTSQEQLNMFLDNMTEDQAIYCIKESLNYCFVKGMFDLQESEAVSKSLRVLFNK
jgi:predicted PolB exonuclease-like 3'-5' exonuclease